MAKNRIFILLLLLFSLCLVFAACGEEEPTISLPTTTDSTSLVVASSDSTTVTESATTTTAPITTEDMFKTGTPGLVYESGGDGTAKVVGISDKSATTVRIPHTSPDGDRVIEVAYGAFAQNTVLETLLLPHTVYKISSAAFFGCTSLTSVVFSEGLETIEITAFQNCTALESLNLPSSLKEMGQMAFAGCTSLRYLTVGEKNATYTAEGNCLLLKNERSVVLGCVGSKLPKDTAVIGDFAFYGMGLEAMLMPDSVKVVGNQAFAENPALSALSLSEGLVELASAAFYNCAALKEVYLPASLTTLGATPFLACSGITRLTVSADNPMYYAKDLCLVKKDENLLVQGFVGAVIPKEIKVIGDSAFSFLPISEIVIPEGVEKIGTKAFAYCNGLKSVSLPESLTEVLPTAFLNAKGIETIVFGGTRHAFDILTAAVDFPESAVITCKK